MELTADAEAPQWIQLLPSGTFQGRDGRGPYTLGEPEAVIAATRSWFGGADMPMDYDHQLEKAAANGQPAPASGWIKELAARSDGLWARVDWTERAAAAVASREYRYVSPVFYHDRQGRISRLESVALTNLPNLELRALSSAHAALAAKEFTMDLLKAMCAALGLPPDSDETAVDAGLRAVLAERDSARAALVEAGKALNAASTSPGDLIKAAQSAALAATPDPSRFVPMDVYAAASKELSEVKAAQAASRATALVEEARGAGKVTPAMEDWAKSYASADPEGFKAWVSLAPDQRPGGEGKSAASAQPPKSGMGLTEEEKAICAACGISEEDFKKAGA